MKICTTLLSSALLLALPAMFCAAPVAHATMTWSTETEDIVYMSDGRVLHGEIISEDDYQIVFEYRHEQFGSIELKLSKDEVSKVEHDVAREASHEESESFDPDDSDLEMDTATETPLAPTDLDEMIARYGANQASTGKDLPSVYIAPMKGQMGTDVHKSVYEEVVEDIDRVKPDLIIWAINCSDLDRYMLHRDEREEIGKLELEHYRELVNLLKDDSRMKSIPQIAWIFDSLGISSVIALSWSDMYMAPGARLDGLSQIFAAGAGWSDPDVRAKMLAAWIAIGNGFLQNGGYPLELGRAMIDPRATLSARWIGRRVAWGPRNAGQYIVDGSEGRTASFTAKTAEDFLISDGTVATLDDLMLLHGYREYRLADGHGDQIVDKYVEDWRRAFKTCEDLAIDFNQHQRWASGDERVKWLGRSKTDLRKMLSLFNRYEAVAVRMADFGWTIFDIEVLIEDITDQIRAIQDTERGGAGGRGGGRGGAGDGPRGG